MLIFSDPFNKNEVNEHMKWDEMTLFIFRVEVYSIWYFWFKDLNYGGNKEHLKLNSKNQGQFRPQCI